MSSTRILSTLAALTILLALFMPLSAQTSSEPAAAPDATLFTTYSLFSGTQNLDWIVCGATTGSSGCYASGGLGPFGKIGAMIEGNPSTSGNIVTRMIYVVDVAAGTSASNVILYVYKKTDTVTSSNDTVTVTLTRSVKLPLTGGNSANCFLAATPTILFIGTDQGDQAVEVKKASLSVTPVSVYIVGPPVTNITIDKYGYVTVTQGNFSSFPNGFSVFNSVGQAQEDGGGADFMLETTMGLSTSSLPLATAHLSERLAERPVVPRQKD